MSGKTRDACLERWLFPLFLGVVLTLGGLALYVWHEGRAIQVDMDNLARYDLALLVRMALLNFEWVKWHGG